MWTPTSSNRTGSAMTMLIVAWAMLLHFVTAAPRSSSLTTSVYSLFESQTQDDLKLRFIKNSGVCETTPGVQQMSGYVDIGTNMSMVGT